MENKNLFVIAIALLCGFSTNSSAQSAGNLPGFSANAFQSPVGYYSSDRPVSVAVGDFNKDGKLDLAVANYYGSYEGGRVSILFGNGDGSFRPPVSYSSGGLSVFVATADLNKDGILDLVVANQNSANVSV